MVKASRALSFFCKPYTVKGRAYFDGALGGSHSGEKGIGVWLRKIVLILTKPANRPRKLGRNPKIAGFIPRRYPAAAEALRSRAECYNEGVALARALERQGRVLIVAPDDTRGVDTLGRDKEKRFTKRGSGTVGPSERFPGEVPSARKRWRCPFPARTKNFIGT